MSNSYYTPPTDVAALTRARSGDINLRDDAVDAAFDKLPDEAKLKRGTVNYAVTGGAADAYTVTLPYVPSGYVDGLLVNAYIHATNTGASTVNVNSLGVKSIKLQDGGAPGAGDLQKFVDLRYSTTTGFFHVQGNTAGSVGAAAASAAAAAAYASAASSSASSAASSAAAAAASYDSFDDRYLGPKTSDPTLDNDGNALLTGALYFNTISNTMRIYTGSAWQPSTASAVNVAFTPAATIAATNVQAAIEEVVSDLAASSGAGGVGSIQPGVGAVAQTVETKLRTVDVMVEEYGAVGDGNYLTGTGTDNATAFTNILAIGAANPHMRFKLKSGAQYRTSGEIICHSYINWVGDDVHSPVIFPTFASSGKRVFKMPTSGSQLSNVTLKGFTVARYGANAEHGLLLDNVDGLYVDLRVISDGSAAGGALGVSAFYPVNRPSQNCYARLRCEKGGNFGLQFGNVDTGTMQVFAKDTMREVIGWEPYVRSKVDFTSAAVSVNNLTWASHGLVTGDPLIYSKQGTIGIPTMTRANFYFAIVIDSNTIQIADTKESAYAGIALSLASTPAGSQRMYRCGQLRNVAVLPSTIEVGDVASGGSATGLVIVTATSGGYIENCTMGGAITIVERNPTSGSEGLAVLGAQGLSFENLDLTGMKGSCIKVTRGFLQGVSDSSGSIDPSISLELLPDVVVRSCTGLQFTGYGLINDYGRCITEFCDFRSTKASAVGVSQSAAAEAAGSYARGNTVYCPNGTGISAVIHTGTINLNDSTTGKLYMAKRADRGALLKTGSGATINVTTITGQSGSTTTYAGKATIIAMNDNTESGNRARYELSIIKASSGGAAAVAALNSQGLTAGAGASHPSFTWSMSTDTLIATPVASTSISATFYFFVSWEGDITAV